MDTDVLRWFKLVAEGVTVTEVSELETVTQSGISRALARLEAQVGTPLLERSGRTLRLTRTGEVFKPHVDRLLAELRGGLDAVAQFVSPETGTVEIGTRRFRAGPEATRPGDLAVRTRQIGNEPLRLAVPAAHRLAARPATRGQAGRSGIPLAEAAGEPFIALRTTSALRKLGDDLCAAAGFRPKIVFEGDDLSNVRGLVTAGLGVAIVPAPRAGSPVAGPGPVLYLPILDAGADRDIYLTWPADRPLLPAVDLFRRHVIDTVSAGRIRPVSG